MILAFSSKFYARTYYKIEMASFLNTLNQIFIWRVFSCKIAIWSLLF